MPREPLKHEAIEISPLERLRIEPLRALVGLMRGLPQLPGMESRGQRANSLGVIRMSEGLAMRARKGLARRGRKRFDRERR
jgi:hypothetical protein